MLRDSVQCFVESKMFIFNLLIFSIKKKKHKPKKLPITQGIKFDCFFSSVSEFYTELCSVLLRFFIKAFIKLI